VNVEKEGWDFSHGDGVRSDSIWRCSLFWR
jgi:hypothetical protein